MNFIPFSNATNDWIDFNTLSGVPIGSKVAILNTSSGALCLHFNALAPVSQSAYFTVYPGQVFTIPANNIKVWMMSQAMTGIDFIYTLGDFGNYIDPRVYDGLKAFTVQSFTEANVKNSTQWELSAENDALASGASFDSVLTTGNKPVIIKSLQISFTGTEIEGQLYEGCTFTGGTIATPYNLNRMNPLTPLAVVRGGATITSLGTKAGADIHAYGTASQGSNTTGSFSVTGLERVLSPNTTYLRRIINRDSTTNQIAVYVTFYEGEISSLN